MSSTNLAGRAKVFPLPGKLALLACRPSRELMAFARETPARGRVGTIFVPAISEKCREFRYLAGTLTNGVGW